MAVRRAAHIAFINNKLNILLVKQCAKGKAGNAASNNYNFHVQRVRVSVILERALVNMGSEVAKQRRI